MRKIAIINQKGGSGKTTTAVNLAASLAEKGRNILLIDLDPQGSSSLWFGASRESKSLYDVFTGNTHLADIITLTNSTNIKIVSSSNWLFGVEKAVANEFGAETILKQELRDLDQKLFDYVLIDCPPNLGILTVNALTAVDEVIIPVEARVMALTGLTQLLQTIDVIKKRLNKKLHIAGIVPCRVDARTKHSREVVATLHTNFKGMLYKTAIRENIRLSEASSFIQPITEYDTQCHGAVDYRALAKEVIKQERS